MLGLKLPVLSNEAPELLVTSSHVLIMFYQNLYGYTSVDNGPNGCIHAGIKVNPC